MHSLRRNLTAVYTIWYRDIVRFFRDRTRIVVSMGQPLLFLFVFGGGLSGRCRRTSAVEAWTSGSSCSLASSR